VALAGGVVLKALHQRPNFYSAAVYLAQSSANLMVRSQSLLRPSAAFPLISKIQILTNLVFLTACTFLIGLQKLLFGPLRPIEIEQLYEKAWFAVTETCLAMTIFRGEIGGWFLVMFFSLLAAKVWGWIGEGRVEVLEQQPPQNPRLFHTRLAISLSISVLFDSYMLEYLVKEVLHQARPDMMVMFGFEFAVLTILSFSTMARYAISLVEIYIVRKQKEKRVEEIRRERRVAAEATVPALGEGAVSGASPTPTDAAASAGPSRTIPAAEDPIDDAEIEVEGWEEKGRWIFYLDLTTGKALLTSWQSATLDANLFPLDFLKLVVYLSFFFILLVFYGLPIHIMRDVFLTCRSFFKRISDFVKYRTATRDMNERYPDATADEIAREDTCIICREEMRPFPPAGARNDAGAQPAPNPVAERMRPKKLPCGHILHFACLRSWLERQQICPTCRRPVVPGPRQAGTIGPPAANAAPGQPVAAVPGQPAADQANQGDLQPAEGQNRFRMLNLGPLRIGFGAGRGDIVNDLAHQINEQARPVQPGNQDHVQQYGFGFGFGRPRPPPARAGIANIHTQLNTIEQRLQQEISELRMASNELHVVRMLEAELNRLRTLRQTAAGQPAHAPTALQAPSSGISPQVTIRPAQTLVANPQQPVLTAGSDALPEGLALPLGWTMMPLHRVDATGHPPAPGMSTSAGPPGNTQTTAAHAHGPTAHAAFSPPSAPRQTEGTNNGLTGSASTTSYPNLGQARRRDGALNGSGNSTQSPVSEFILTNGDVVLPDLHAGEVPHATSSAATEDSATTTNQNHADSTATLPSLPAWGSSTPLPTPVPSQPSASAQNAGGPTVGQILGSGPVTRKDGPSTAPSANGTNRERSNGEDIASSSQDKGKAKAATVEDFTEDVD